MEMFLTDSDCDSSSESSSDYLDDIDSLYGGQAQSILSSLERSIGKIDDFLAFERGFVYGDIVCSETDPSGQLGRVVDMDIVVDLETIRGEILREVDAKKLLKIRSMVVGDYVIHGPWLGRVSKVIDRLTILFDDGAKCEIDAGDSDSLIPVSPSVVEDSQYPFYPDQRIRIRYSNVFKSARWLCGAWKENRAEGIVCHVEAGLAHINWVASIVVGCDTTMPSPPCLQDSKDLTLLSCFSHANWELGDWCTLHVDDQKFDKEHLRNLTTVKQIKQMESERGPLKTSSDSNSEKSYVIVKRKTKIDILWQDGTHSIGLDSQALLPVNNVGDHEFWPEQFVLEKSSCDDLHVSGNRRLGIVQSMDAKERTVKVKWKSHPGNETDNSGEDNEETVSAYELIEHPDYSYCLGDIVFLLEKILSVAEPDGQLKHEGHQTIELMLGCLDQLEKGNLSSKKISENSCECPDKHYLSFIGNVIGYKDEGIIVRWASGLTSKVEPYEIAGIDKYEDSVAVSTHFEEDNGDSLTEEVSAFEKQIPHQKEKDVLENPHNGIAEDHSKNIWETSTFFSRAAIGFFTNITATLFGSGGSTSFSGSLINEHSCGLWNYQNLDSEKLASEDEDEDERRVPKKELTECCNMSNEESPIIFDELCTNLKQQTEEAHENNSSSSCERSGQFKQFDIVDDFSDHHFANGANKESIGQVKRGWLKSVHHEWGILEKGLPDTIYVRAYEERIDLLRAAVFGAPGTPYHDGVFFFEFLLPPDYPHEPPLVHFNSGGLRLNPNLYESGGVCLSLLNTWTGTGTEAWNPGCSTILQVLLSLQALVLNEKPYFNEAGYDQQIGRAEGEKNSMTYNENAFITSCKYMIYILRKPPKHFEALVEEHFCHHSHSILLACKAYMDGAPVGCAFGTGIGDGETQKNSSTGFKLILAKLLPKLVSSFTEKGIDCSHILESV